MELHYLVAAVVTSTALHRAMEPDNLLRKLRRLDGALKTGTIAELPMKGINTRPKAYALGISMLIIVAAIAYWVVSLVDPSVDGALQYAIIASVVGELILLVRLDTYHVDIEKITQRVGKKKKK